MPAAEQPVQRQQSGDGITFAMRAYDRDGSVRIAGRVESVTFAIGARNLAGIATTCEEDARAVRN